MANVRIECVEIPMCRQTVRRQWFVDHCASGGWKNMRSFDTEAEAKDYAAKLARHLSTRRTANTPAQNPAQGERSGTAPGGEKPKRTKG